jgi:hypothetical protein
VLGHSLVDLLRAYGGQWWRFVLLQVLVLLGLSAIIGAFALLLQGNGAALTQFLTADPAQFDARAAGIGAVVAAAIALVAIPFLVAGTAATARVTDAALAGRRPRLWPSIGRGFARFLPLLGTLVLAFLLVVAVLLATPFISLVGVLGLAVSGVIALVRRRRPGALAKWPGWRTWGFAAIPFAWAGRVIAAALLMLPASVPEPAGPLRAYLSAEKAATGNRASILAVSALAFVASLGLSAGFALLGSALWGDLGGALLGALVQLAALPLPIVAAVALYRRAAGPSGRMLARANAPVPSRTAHAASPLMTRIALLTIAALVATTIVVIPLGVSSASADPANAGHDVSFVVSSAADSLDTVALAAQQASCRAAGPDCTIRAALGLAAQDAADGAHSATIGFASGMTITLAGPLDFTPTAGAGIAGTLAIDGSGVVLDGGDSYRILSATSALWNLTVSGLTFRHGHSGGFAGALQAGVPQTRLQSVVFDGNAAAIGGGAVFAQALTVLDSTFLDSRVTGFGSSSLGGAIRATGHISIVNSTFSGSVIGDQYTTAIGNGSDVYADADMDVVNSTFVNSKGGSLRAAQSSTIRNSLFTTDWAGGGFMCDGTFTGGANFSKEGDNTCPGTSGLHYSPNVLLPLDSTGKVPVFPLNPSGNPALGVGVSCPPFDALGVARASSGCDLGAAEFNGSTSIALEAVPNTTVVGSVTVRATVTGDTSALPQGAVTFTFDGVNYGPITLSSPAPAIAEVAVTGLVLGSTYTYSAAYTPSGPFQPSASNLLSYTVKPVQVAVDLLCANPAETNPAAAPECLGNQWNIADTESIHLTATVTDASAGTIKIALDPAGATVVAAAKPTVGGKATFVIPGSAFGLGSRDLYAIFLSDDGSQVGVSPIARPLVVLRTPVVTISGVASSGIYGDPVAGTFTVTVSGSGAKPTGIVTVFGHPATLDASGTATLDLSDLSVGTAFALSASYAGDGVYGRGISNTVGYETTAAGTTTQIGTISPAAPHFGEPVSVMVTVKAVAPSGRDPQGSVTLVVDGTQSFGPIEFDPYTQNNDGTMTFEVVVPAGALGAGDHQLVAEFNGHGNFTNSVSPSASLSLGLAPTTTALVASPTPSVFGDQVTLTATVDATGIASIPTGTIAFSAGARSLGTAALAPCAAPNTDGCAVASLTVLASALGVGTTTLGANYQGATDLASSSASIAGYVVSKATPTVTVTGAGGLIYGQSATYTVTVGTTLLRPADGTQLVLTAVPAIGAPIPLGTVSLVNGSATVLVPTLGTLVPGAYAITAAFAGNGSFEAATGSSTLTVNNAATDIGLDSISSTTVVYGNTLDVVLSVANTSTASQPEGDVVVTWLGHEVGRATLTPANDTATPGVRTVRITADFGATIPGPSEFWLTAEFVPALGFAADHLKTDANEERRWVTVTPMQTEVSVDMTAVLGQPLAATAHVDIVGANLGIVPGGGITFLITKSGAGTQQVGPIALVNGQVMLAQALGAFPIPVNIAGTWSVRATYVKDSDFRYAAVSPSNTAITSSDVVTGGAVVTADAPTSPEFGLPVVVHATVAGAVVPDGTVRVQLSSFGNLLVSAEVPLVDGKADLTVDPGWLAFGASNEFVVRYSGGIALNVAFSAPFTIAVGKTATHTTVSTTSQVFALYPGIVGSPVHYTAHVAASVGTPTGNVAFSRDSAFLGFGQLDGNGDASITVVPDADWSGNIVAAYQSATGTMATSTGTLAHSWIHAPVTVTLQGPPSGTVGVAADYRVGVQFDSAQFQFLDAGLGPQYAPSGTVTISDGGGTSCTAILVGGDNLLSHATCQAPFGQLGSHAFTASYAGNMIYASGTSPTVITNVGKGTPALTLTTPNGDNWAGLTTIPVDWSVAGPADGTVTVKLGTATVCSSTSLVGSCNVAVPAYSNVTNGNRLTLEYGGGQLWNAGTTTLTGTIIACIPFEQPSSNPAGAATVTFAPAPTCGAGTGYYTTDLVAISAVPVDGNTVTGFSGGQIPGTPFRTLYPADTVSLYPNGGASMLIHPVLGFAGTQVIPFGFRANTQAQCVSVRFQTTGIANRSDAINTLFWDAPNTCGSVPTVSGNSVTQLVPNGAQVRVTYQAGFIPARTKFYGWQGLASGDAFATSATYTIGPDTRTITAAFGPTCYDSAPTVVQPSDGTITLSLGPPNCTDPQTKKSGWLYNTPGTATLADAVGTTLKVVSTRYGSLNGYMQAIQDKAWVPDRPIYFTGWGGDTGSFTVGATTTATDASGVRRDSHTISFRLGELPFTVTASYAGCTTLSTQVIGDASNGAPGTITMNTAGNCPLGAGFGAARWYKAGTQVSLTTAATGKTLKFLGWGGFPVPTGKTADTTISFALNANAVATASYGTNANCRPFTISEVPAGALTLDTTFTLGANACAAEYGSKFYDQGVGGNGILIDASPATAAANGAETVFAWATNVPGSAAGTEGGLSSLWQRTTQLNELFYGNSTVVAYACEFVTVGANVSSPDGTFVSSASSTNISRETQSRLANYVITQPADCSTGSDPRSGYGGYAWIVGTQLVPVVTADPVAYKFTGWSGDVKGTGQTSNAPLNLVGPGHTAQGDNYHYHVAANFTAICYTLSLPSDADKLEVITAPNCPGVDASRRMYLGGTAVVLHAPDKGNTLFRNWASGVDTVDADTHWASVTMTSDKSVVPYYSSKSAGEYISTYGTMVGDSLAVGSKKLLGVATAAVSAYFKAIISNAALVASGIGYIAQGLEYFGVQGAVIDGMKNASSAMNNMIALLFAPMDCLTAWSAGGKDTAFYAAQNFIGGAIVATLSASATKPKDAATAASTFQTLKTQAAAAAPVAGQGVAAILAAKSIYDAAASGNLGWESSAYDAWASQSSLSVYTTCMASTAGSAATSVMTVGG